MHTLSNREYIVIMTIRMVFFNFFLEYHNKLENNGGEELSEQSVMKLLRECIYILTGSVLRSRNEHNQSD
jgi:hypothetical protein